MQVAIEADAVLIILAQVHARRVNLIWSAAHVVEIASNPNLAMREGVLGLLTQYGHQYSADAIPARARVAGFMNAGIQLADAVHVAMAEAAGADFVTCDDRLLRALRRTSVGIWCGTAVGWCAKEELA